MKRTNAQSVQMHAARALHSDFTARGRYALSKNCFTERAFKRRDAEMRKAEEQCGACIPAAFAIRRG